MKYAKRYVCCIALGVLLLVMILTNISEAETAQESLALLEEDKLVVYTSHKKEVYGPIIKEFEERTGIWVEVVTGGTNELLEQIAKENGNNSADIMFGGGVDSLSAYNQYFQSYRSKQFDHINHTYVADEDKWTAFSSLPIVFIYNNKLVYSAGRPRSWSELLSGRWQGEISFANPGKSGTSFTALATMLQVLGDERTEDALLDAFVENLDGNIADDSGAVLDEVMSGTRLIGITLEETALKKMAAGADIGLVYPIEGTSAVPDGCAIIKGAPHEENAKLFLEFTVSEDVQHYLTEQCYRRPVRVDVMENGEALVNEISYHFDSSGTQQNTMIEKWNERIQ